MPNIFRAARGRNLWRAIGLGISLLFFLTPPAPFPQPMPRGFGTSLGDGFGGAAELQTLGVKWYLDFEPAHPTLPKYQRMYIVYTSTSVPSAVALAQNHRGGWWQFGNEPNDPNQDNVSPQTYARLYRDFYFGIKRVDPSAQITAPGIADADWKWADAFRESYRSQFGSYPLLDGWSIHNYILDTCVGATDAEQFKTRIVAFRDWMARTGQAHQPLFLTEYGVLYGNGCCGCPLIPPEQVVHFMQATTRWMAQTQFVQGWAWFIVESGNKFNGDLFTNARMTVFGNAYRELILEQSAR